jgi:dienelactone hydrolase
VREQPFDVEVAGVRVPGLVWTPPGDGPYPLVLMGHGVASHKRSDTILTRARRYVEECGFAVAAIDAPDHGERVDPARAAELAADTMRRVTSGTFLDPDGVRTLLDRARRAGPEWTATVDRLTELGVTRPGRPIGYLGVSHGTLVGLGFVAGEPRITAAVFGLFGALPGDTTLLEAAAGVRVPVEFALQSADEIFARDTGLALFDALGSAEKSLHLNPGGHLALPAFEEESWERFLRRHLLHS